MDKKQEPLVTVEVVKGFKDKTENLHRYNQDVFTTPKTRAKKLEKLGLVKVVGEEIKPLKSKDKPQE
jgi:hypothetical protein